MNSDTKNPFTKNPLIESKDAISKIVKDGSNVVSVVSKDASKDASKVVPTVTPGSKLLEGRKSILVVEDNLSLRHWLFPIIHSVDELAIIEWSTSAEEALLKLQRRKHDLILSDFYLEGSGTGLDLWKHCRNSYKEIPFIFMSGISREAYLELFDTQEIPPLVSKPLNSEEIRKTLAGLLD